MSRSKAYLTFNTDDSNGMCWPNPSDPMEVEWSLRYGPDSSTAIAAPLTREMQLYAASVISAYQHLVGLDKRTRQLRVMQLRAAAAESIREES